MKCLITGGAGFIGSHLADRLLADGHDVMVLDNYATGRHDNLRGHERLAVREGTIADASFVRLAFDDFRPDRVAHAAAAYKDPDAWGEDVLSNMLGTVNVVRASMDAKVERFIYFQTALCYGTKPIEQPITLDHPMRGGGSSYAISKTAAEQYLDMSGLDSITFRLANVYGPRNLSGPLPTFFQRLTSGKKCFVVNTRRDFLYVTDLVSVVTKALNGMGTKGAYHVSSGRDVSIEDLYRAVLAALGMDEFAPVEIRERGPDDAASILLDPSKTERDFQWKAESPLRPGVATAVAYYRAFGIQETFTHLRIEGHETR